jgi:hypothetical protein
MTPQRLAKEIFALALAIAIPVGLAFLFTPHLALVVLFLWGGLVVGIRILQAVVARVAPGLSRPRPRGVLILPGPLQALVGATVFAITVPSVIYVFWSRWPITTYFLVGAGIFVFYIASFALGLVKPYKP